jgi:hypothetical protein
MDESSLKERLIRLARNLLEKTGESAISWQPTDRPDAYLAPLRRGSVIIRTRDADGFAPFELGVLNSDGVEVESLASLSDSGATDRSVDIVLRPLHDLARRRAFTVDETIDGLIDELEE